MNKTAFTLVEIIIVVIIISAIASMAFPKYISIIEKTHAERAKQTLLEVYGAQKRYYINHDSYATSLSALDIAPKGSDQFKTPLACENGSGGCAQNDSIAEIERDSDDPKYTLSININMMISCDPAASSAICERLGF